MEKKYQVFISSTYKDLNTARKKVSDMILSMEQFPVGMEMFGAQDENQWKVIQKTIDQSDYYIVIVGKCLGSQVPGEDISYTQKEFRYAKEKNIPILAFIASDDADIAKSNRDTETEKIKKLNEFKRELETGRMVDYWKDYGDLAAKVAVSLYKAFYFHPMPGWIRTKRKTTENKNRIGKVQWEDYILRAKLMLLYASANNGEIIVSKTRSGSTYLVGGKYNMNASQFPREIAVCDAAIEFLVKADLIGLEKANRQKKYYNITIDGYKKADEFGNLYDLDPTKPPEALFHELQIKGYINDYEQGYSKDIANRVELLNTVKKSQYHSPDIKGSVSFDYTNNSKQYSIGSGEYEFITTWSTCGNNSIYAYRDNVKEIGYRSGCHDFPELSDIETFDFTSRARVVYVGEVVIWMNQYGHFAATKITGVTREAQGTTANLSFEYLIYT